MDAVRAFNNEVCLGVYNSNWLLNVTANYFKKSNHPYQKHPPIHAIVIDTNESNTDLVVVIVYRLSHTK